MSGFCLLTDSDSWNKMGFAGKLFVFFLFLNMFLYTFATFMGISDTTDDWVAFGDGYKTFSGDLFDNLADNETNPNAIFQYDGNSTALKKNTTEYLNPDINLGVAPEGSAGVERFSFWKNMWDIVKILPNVVFMPVSIFNPIWGWPPEIARILQLLIGLPLCVMGLFAFGFQLFAGRSP